MPTGVYERTEEMNRNMSIAKMGHEAWNEGLTKKTDKRVEKNSKNIKIALTALTG